MMEFAEKLRAVLKNPNGMAVYQDTIYLYTDDHELVSFSVPCGQSSEQ